FYFFYFLFAGFNGRLNPFHFKKKYPNSGSKKFRGTASLFIPCKGNPLAFETNIRTLLEMADLNIRIYFIVENKNDPAFNVINNIIKDYDQAFVVQAGTASVCSQKNYNLLKGIEASGQKDDIYVFLDADTCFTTEKLNTLLRPLDDPSIVATCGFQWNILKKKNFGDRFMSFLIATQWMSINIPFFKWFWGGAMSLKRETYETLGIHDYWSRRAVDDISLTPLMLKHKKKICFVPIVVNEQHQGITSVKKAIQWYTRQYIYLKYYTFSMWLLGLFSLTFFFGQLWVLPVLLIGAAIFKPLLFMPLLFYSLCILCSIIIGTATIKYPYKDNFSLISWIFLSPAFAALLIIPVLKTLFTWKMKWANVVYKVNRKGIVTEMIRE
ncbi:MAG: glycosyltransferase family 2 protein, partial [Candidatus Pacearchaeota archaeon]|nr:glycosyltransferase family 2 protein [Candidatus Pacearchaeota archaeon]